MRGVMVDHEIAIRRETVHARRRFAKSSRCAGHPCLEDLCDWSYIPRDVHLAIDCVRRSYLAESMKGDLEPIAEIGEPIKRRGQSGPTQKKRREAISGVPIRAGRKPRLHVSLHAQGNAERFERFLEPRA